VRVPVHEQVQDEHREDDAEHGEPSPERNVHAYLHASIPEGGRATIPWREDFNALVYVLAGSGTVGTARTALAEGRSAVLGPGTRIDLQADATIGGPHGASGGSYEVLVLGGLPIKEQIAWYGPFVMNTSDEIHQAVEDYQRGRMGVIPPRHA
jgi:quercetin 2,3-dioxygenase